MEQMITADRYRDDYQQRAAHLSGEPTWLTALRQQAIEHFVRKGFPTLRDERWKYTRLATLEKHFYPVLNAPAASQIQLAQLEPWLLSTPHHRLVFVDGHYAAELSQRLTSLPSGAILTHLAAALQQPTTALKAMLSEQVNGQQHRFHAQNTAFMTDGVYLQLADQVIINEPIHILYITTAPQAASYLCNILALGAYAQANIIEQHLSFNPASSFANTVTEIQLAEHSQLTHYLIQQQNDQATHIGAYNIQQAQHSHFNSYAITLGGALVRNDINVRLLAEYAHCQLQGLYYAKGRQHIDYHTHIDHAQPHGTSYEHYKGIIQERARAVFNGKILVRQDAQKTNAQLANENLLLSRHAEIDTKPELEIYADDVKCSHGATIGQLDEDSLFYLRSRGIDSTNAQNILTYAFANEIIATIQHEVIRQQLHNTLIQQLFQGQAIPVELV